MSNDTIDTSQATNSTDRIEKHIVIAAPRARVWRAIADVREFGSWFRVNLQGQFEPGARLRGNILEPNWEHLVVEIDVEKVEPERLLSFRWHPAPADPKRDYTSEPKTLVEFMLADAPDGTLLVVRESGFDALPVERRAEAYRMNEGGWAVQVERVARHVAAH
ncbi:MAG: SRPBCC family protein [Myxococcota bacterium]